MSTVALAGGAFVFGKLPRHGDFVARGLQPEVRSIWDDRFSYQLSMARERLGANFEAAHGLAPPWRFCFGPGPFGSGWRAGCVAPSVDASGRMFFIVVGGHTPLALSDTSAESVACSLEGLIYDALQSAWDVDTLFEAAQTEWVQGFDRAVPAAGADVTDRWWVADTTISTTQFPQSLIEPLIEEPAMQAGL